MDIKDKKSCEKLYNKLAKDISFNKRIRANDFVVNLFETKKCDHYKDLSYLREKYEQKIGKENLERILHNKFSEISIQKIHDDIICEDTIVHHYYLTKKSIESCLPWKTWLYYKLENL